MYLTYVDESGNANYNDNLPFYNLTGVIVNEKDWIYVDNALTKLKLEFFPNFPPEDIEFHAKQIRNKNGIFSHFDEEQIKNIFEQFYNTVSNMPIKVISILVNKREILQKQIKFNPIEDKSWECLLERFDMFIAENNKENTQFGLAIIDSEGERIDTELRGKIRKIVKTGTNFHKFRYIIEDVLFTYSHWRNLTQISDMIAYCIVKNKESNQLFSKYFKKIENKLHCDENGCYSGFGLKIIPRDIKW